MGFTAGHSEEAVWKEASMTHLQMTCASLSDQCGEHTNPHSSPACSLISTLPQSVLHPASCITTINATNTEKEGSVLAREAST